MSKRQHLEKLVADDEWVESFMIKIKENPGDLETPCWEWQGGLDKAGYGRVHIKKHCEKKSGRNFYSHRLSYMIHRGYITPKEFILHQCHNRLCCNPEHFKIGDHNDNMDDLSRSGRVSGENNHKSKLTEDEVWDILTLYYEEHEWSVKELMEEFGVGRGTVTDILYERTWNKVSEEYFGED